MNFKSTYILFGSLLVILAVAGVMLMTGPKPGEEGLLLQGAKASKLAAKDFDSFTIDRKAPQAETIAFLRGANQKWKVTKPIEALADSAAVDRAIDDLLSARREGKGDVSKNLAELGLAPPSLVVTLGRAGGTSYTVSLGKATIGANGEVYAVSSESPKSPTPIRRSTLSSLLKEGNEATTAGEIVKGVADFRSRDLLLGNSGINPAEGVQSVKLSDGKTTIALAKKDSAWTFAEPANLGAADAKGEGSENPNAVPTGVEQLIKAISAVKPANVTDIIDAPADFATFGLEPGKEVGLRVEVGRKPTAGDAPVTETLLVGNKDEKAGQVFVRLQGERAVAKIDAKLLEPLAKTLARPVNLRERQLLAFNPNECDGVDIKLAGSEHAVELRKQGEPPTWKLFSSSGASQLANALVIRELLSAFGGKPVKDFPDPSANDAALGFDRPQAEVTLWVHGILPEERKDATAEKDKAAKPEDKAAKAEDKTAKPDEKATKPEEKPAPPATPRMKEPSARLIFGKRDKDLLYVRRVVKDKDGKESHLDFAVSESLWPKVTRGAIEYIDPTLPSFVNANATKLTFNRGGETFTIEKQEATPHWIIRQPADRAERGADIETAEQILSELSTLRAIRLWSEKPTDRELERYGLQPPRIKAVVTTKDGDKTQETTYSFGNETDDKSGIYARQSGRDLVFVVRKELITSLENAELQDPVISRIDPSRVTGIKLTGWKDVVGQPMTRDLERKGPSNWAMRGDSAAKVSAGQCEALLKALAMIRAEKFVAHKSGQKPEQKLTVPEGAPEITVTVEGEKDPVSLTIGGTDPDAKHFYATCSKVPGDVFLLPKGIFEAIKAKPGYFSAE